MTLYHYSNEFLDVLKPLSKDKTSGKHCIWFTSSDRGFNGQNWHYRYKTEIADDDESLEEYSKVFEETKGEVRWFKYFDQIEKKNFEVDVNCNSSTECSLSG